MEEQSSSFSDTRQRAISLLDRLKPPHKSKLGRKQKTVTNAPPCGKCKTNVYRKNC